MIQPQDMTPAEIAALLHFYADAGVEAMLEDVAPDRFVEFATQQQARQNQTATRGAGSQGAGPQDAQRQGSAAGRANGAQAAPPRPATATPIAIPDAQAVAEARRVAASATSLAELREALGSFEHCSLKRSARQAILAAGAVDSGIMVIGAVPGADEDRDGLPFAGRAGEMFDRMLAAIGLSRDKVVVVNALPWRPPGNRVPNQPEMDICRPFLERQLELCAPKTALILGNFAARYLLNPNASLHLMRGEWHPLQVGDVTIDAMPSLHPEDLLRAPGSKRLAWQDLLHFREKLRSLSLI